MIRTKEPFDREKFYKLIEKKNWHELWALIDSTLSVNITEEDLRLAFNILPKKYQFRNLYNWGNRFSVDFLREFADRFDYRIFDCVKLKQKTSKIVEEFIKYWPEDDWISYDEVFTDALKYPHDFNYVKKYYKRFSYPRIFNMWGHREKFNLPQEEIDFLKEYKKRYWEN